MISTEGEKMKKDNKERKVYIEQLRIIAILAVIMIHCYAEYFANSSIYGTRTWLAVNTLNGMTRWAVPMFFMISGILTLGTNKQEKVVAYLKRNLVMY